MGGENKSTMVPQDTNSEAKGETLTLSSSSPCCQLDTGLPRLAQTLHSTSSGTEHIDVRAKLGCKQEDEGDGLTLVLRLLASGPGTSYSEHEDPGEPPFGSTIHVSPKTWDESMNTAFP